MVKSVVGYSEQQSHFADIIKSAVDPRGGSVEMPKSASKFGKIFFFQRMGRVSHILQRMNRVEKTFVVHPKCEE